MKPAAAVVTASVAWVIVTVTAQVNAARTDLSTTFDKTFVFASVKSWAWHPEGPGDIRTAYSATDDPKLIASRVDPIVIPAVERGFAARGLAQTDAARADIHV